jgi:stearoyl-CoA desaturase (delta-9 desaturase)
VKKQPYGCFFSFHNLCRVSWYAEFGCSLTLPLQEQKRGDLVSSKTYRAIVLCAVIIPFIGFVAAIALSWGRGLDPLSFTLFLLMLFAAGLGITVGFHRLFTHQSFRTTSYVRIILGICGSMAVEGSLFSWVGDHRTHHQHSDKPGDPHSPWAYGTTFKGALKGFFHAHMGWMISNKNRDGRDGYANVPQAVRDDALLAFVNRFFLLWVVLGFAIPFAIGGVVSRSWKEALLCLLWGGLVRIFVLHHLTWSVNSVCHMFGSRMFRTTDESRNNFICALLGFGEGNHNNHHAFPQSACHGMNWRQPDLSYLVIMFLKWCGLATDVNVPTKIQRQGKLIKTGA